MNFVDRFSFEDFVGYLFPGTIGALGVYVILLITPLKDLLVMVNLDIFGGILFFIFSYAFGFILSGISIPLTRRIFKIRGFVEPRSLIIFPEFSKEITEAYKHVFKSDASDDVEWSLARFYLVRSLVEEYMPNAARYIQRQDHLSCLRFAPTVLISFSLYRTYFAPDH